MRDYDLHQVFYYQILSPLRELTQSLGKHESRFSSAIGYETRPDNLRYNYAREKFINNRSKFFIMQNNETSDRYIILMKLQQEGDNMVIYKQAAERLFGEGCLDELVSMMKKFYTVTVEEKSLESRVDLSTNRREGDYLRVNDLSGL